MTHSGFQRHHPRSGSAMIGVGQTVHREVRLLRPREPQHGHGGIGDPDHRIPHLLIALVAAQMVSVMVSGIIQMAAAVSRDRKLETGINADHRAGDHPTPGKPRKTDLGRIHFGKRTQQRVGQHTVGHGVIHPLIGDRTHIRVQIGTGTHRSGHVMNMPSCIHKGPSRLIIRLSLDGDADGRIATLGPFFHPIFMRSSTAAMHQHHTWHRTTYAGASGNPHPSMDAGRVAEIIQRIKINRFEVPGSNRGCGPRCGVVREDRRSSQHSSVCAERCHCDEVGRVIDGIQAVERPEAKARK